MKLCFGQIVLPYANTQKSKKGKKGEAKLITSIQVARWLEKKYHLKEVFYNANKKEIHALYNQAAQDALNNAAHGVFKTKDLNILFGKANKKTTQMFRDALNKRAFGATRRGELGISRRFKYGYVTKKNKSGVFRLVRIKLDSGKTKTLKVYSRPAFIDTQLYRNSSETWVE